MLSAQQKSPIEGGFCTGVVSPFFLETHAMCNELTTTSSILQNNPTHPCRWGFSRQHKFAMY
jgi:hypothetical protein